MQERKREFMEVMIMDGVEVVEGDACPVCGMPVPAKQIMWWTKNPEDENTRPLHEGCIKEFFGLAAVVK